MNIRNKCFFFLWKPIKQSEGIPLVKWSSLALPEDLCGWGVKDPSLFYKSLGEKALCRLAHNPNTLRGRVMTLKYFPKSTLVEWFINPI